MTEHFDPYHEWLGIPPEDQPPHHYRLLAIKPFEDNLRVIENAADRQMGHLRTFQMGKHSAISQKLLNEVAAARVCLLRPERKAEYDRQLRAILEPPAVQPASQEDTSSALGKLFEQSQQEFVAHQSRAKKRTKNLPLPAILAMVGGVLLVGLFLLWRKESGSRETAQRPKTSPPVVTEREKPDFLPAPRPAADPTPPTPVRSPKPAPVAPPPQPEKEKPVAKPAAPSSPPPKPTPPPEPVRPPPAPVEKKKLPAPSDQALEQAQKLVRDTFQDEYNRAKTPAEKTAVAKKLLAAGKQESDEPSARFALLRTARDSAIQAGDLETAFEAIDRLGESFTVDPLEMKVESLSGLSKTSRTTAQRRTIVEQGCRLLDAALASDQYALARELGKLAASDAGTLRDKETATRLRTKLQDVATAEKAFEAVSAAKTRLAEKPDDPEANFTYGRFLCLTKGDWDRGLPLLAKGSNPAWRDFATKDLVAPKTAADQLALADAVWDLSEKESLPGKRQLQQRAANWYYIADLQLAGVDKTRAEKRIKIAGLVTQIVNPVDGSILIYIPAGTFLAGPEKFPVRLPAYYLGLHEVTMAQYKKFIDATGHSPPTTNEGRGFGWSGNNYPAGKANHPVSCLSWDDAVAYCRWAGLRLPTELEWEKGARGLDGRIYPWGDTWDASKCRSRVDSPTAGFCPVMSYPEGRSPWGLLHMSGNSIEWCADWFAEDSYARYRQGDLTVPTSGEKRVMRGGSWGDTKVETTTLRSDRRTGAPPQARFAERGFRVAKSVGQ